MVLITKKYEEISITDKKLFIVDAALIFEANYNSFFDSNLLITQFDNSVVERAGMLKMDFLGLNTLSQIKDAIIELERYTMGYVDNYLHDGREMIQEAKQIRSRLKTEYRKFNYK